MVKKALLAVGAVFVVWSALDLIQHVLILGPVYQANADLWRAPDAMKPAYIHTAVLLSSIAFTAIYAGLIKDRRPGTGLSYGFLWGVANGFAMGFCTYAVQPIPFELAVVWTLGSIIEASLAGLMLGGMLKN
jgi:predicted cobalt transporter CbtA